MQRIHFHGRNLRKGRCSEPGRIYHVTSTTRDREPVFDDFLMARRLINLLFEQQGYGHADTLAFVVMPDHLHWLLQLQGGRSLSEVVGSVKSLSSRAEGRPIWQSGFHDHALRVDEDVRDAARYIVLNPVRAGLVERVTDYPHWDCIWL
jgi:putative transposase